jgi:hypothetical protein
LRWATIMRMSGERESAERDFLTAHPPAGHSIGVAFREQAPPKAATAFRIAPIAWFLVFARLVIAVGAVILLIAIVTSLVRWRAMRFPPGEIWALFATFVLSIGVLVLYEIRDLLRQRQNVQAAHRMPESASGIIAPVDDVSGSIWRSIGSLGAFAWLPFQSDDDRLLIKHLTPAEQQELLSRLAAVTTCMAVTTIAPIVVAFLSMSPVAVCIATTLIASNLFVLDWFKKRHKKWIYSTGYALKHGIKPPGEKLLETVTVDPLNSDT